MPKDFVHFWIIGTGERQQKLGALRTLLGDREYRWKQQAASTHVYVPAEGAIVQEIELFLRDDLGLPGWKGVRERHWSAAERARARWHLLVLTVQPEGTAGNSLGNRLDLSAACPTCLLGARYVGCFRMDLTLRRDRVLHQLHTNEWIVNGKARRALAEAGIRGVEFLPAVAVGGDPKKADRYLVQPLHLAPAADRSSPLQQGACCPTCKADGWGGCSDTQNRFVYEVPLPDDLDFLFTREGIGTRGTTPNLLSYYKVFRRELLVSRKVYEVLKCCGVRGVEFRPVESIDDQAG